MTELEAVTEAILKEARENGADSPVDAGDAEQLARAAIKALDERRGVVSIRQIDLNDPRAIAALQAERE